MDVSIPPAISAAYLFCDSKNSDRHAGCFSDPRPCSNKDSTGRRDLIQIAENFDLELPLGQNISLASEVTGLLCLGRSVSVQLLMTVRYTSEHQVTSPGSSRFHPLQHLTAYPYPASSCTSRYGSQRKLRQESVRILPRNP